MNATNVTDADYSFNHLCDHRWPLSEGLSHCCALSAGHDGDTHICTCHAMLTEKQAA